MNIRLSISAILLASLLPLAARAQSTTPSTAPDTQPSPLHFSWAALDHPSAIYHPTDPASLAIFVDNPTSSPQPLAGEILFGPSLPNDTFKPLSVTPISPATIAPGQRAKLPLALTFANVGPYELRYRPAPDSPSQPISHPRNLPLLCTFAPRTDPNPAHPPPWILPLPREAAFTPGFLTDLSHQTSASTFLLDDTFRFDPQTRIALAPGASLDAPPENLDALFTEAARLRSPSNPNAGLILRLAIPLSPDPDTPQLLAQYITDTVKRFHNSLRALILTPQLPPNSQLPPPAAHDRFHVLYLAAYKAAKAADKNILLLGAGSAPATRDWLLSGQSPLSDYLDALALSDPDQFADLPALFPAPLKPPPLWVIPAGADHWADTPAAAALAIGAAMVPLPAPADDRGATAHLLGNARFYQLIHPAAARIPDAPPDLPPLPFVAVFQADQFSVAAIAGPGAGTPLDRAYPTLAAGKTVIIPASDPDQDDPPYANLRLPDDAAALRAVDAAGAPIDCRVGDYLYVPAAEKLVYVLAGGAGGNAEELAALLRPATANRLPAFDFSLAIPPDIAHTGEGGLTLRLTNISPNPLPGTLRLFRMPPATTQPAASQLAAPPKPELLTSRPFDTLPPGKTLNTFLDAGPSIRPGQTLLLEITTPTLTQRTALILH